MAVSRIAKGWDRTLDGRGHSMNIELLRRSTAEDHAAVEGAIPLMGTDLVLGQYVSVLRRMYGMVSAWERLCERDGPRWMQPMLKERQRRALLEEDLRVLGSELPGSELPNGGAPRLPEFASDAEFLGAMYVMEGSRLGGLMIAKHVEGVLGLEAGRGDAYFRGGGDRRQRCGGRSLRFFEREFRTTRRRA